MNVNSWVDAMSNKLEDIGITRVSHLRQEIVQVNKKLRDYGHSMLHTRTLHLIAQEGEKEVVASAQQMNDEIAQLQNELALSCSKERPQEAEDWTDGCNDTAFSVVSKAKMSKFGLNTWLGDSGASSTT